MEDPNTTDADAFTLTLTRPQLKVVHAAVKAYYEDFGHQESGIEDIARAILEKLPGEEEIDAIDLGLPR